MHLDLSGDNTFASPLKRSDATMDFDQAPLGSPVAKRRSLHGFSTMGSDLNAFNFASPDSTPTLETSFEIHNDASQPASPANVAASSPIPAPEPQASSTPPTASKRASTLRKSTIQQRYDPRSSWGRRQGEKYLAQQLQQQQQQQQPSPQLSKRSSGEWLFSASTSRSRPRASLDQFMKPEVPESPSPFKVKGSLPNPSPHPFERSTGPSAPGPGHQPHPLSRTLTTSSSNSSVPDDSPTHFPVQPPPERPRPSIFARSLPVNAHRPRPEPIATPQYKSARPLQSVFASASLISKMGRNGEDEAPQRTGGRTMIMPDTPCKKQVYPSNTYPPSSGSGSRKQQSNRRFFLSAGPESTPFSPDPSRLRGGSVNNANESVVNFFKLRSSHARRSSILSIDGDGSDSQGIVDSFDLPPTPTKSVLAKNIFAPVTKDHESPTTSPVAASTTPAAPAPLHIMTRSSGISFESPAGSFGSESMSPKTPRGSSVFSTVDFGSMAPPDASRLSISNANNASTRSGPAIFPPATPTADREAFVNFVDRRVSITPVHGHSVASHDADAVLASMFRKVECVGRGEFSQVFRVVAQPTFDHTLVDCFGTTPSKRSPADRRSLSAAATQKVFAVKKIRLPFFGQKEREAKLREVTALEAVRDRENVLQIFDHWERNGHLYIQTEYCEEGGMDNFLKKAGEHGRLDDFRIWKILLEIAQGLRYIHDAGYIHLDLKPANILVTYEGHLKIGDFGMATEWPAPKGIEGEGDREYIGPEILQGKYDKPSDIFSLGLIVLEIACNVFLPDNGPVWVALREGDMSVVPSLTAGEANALVRDPEGMPVVVDGEGAGADVFNLADSLDLPSTSTCAGATTPPSFDFTRTRYEPGSIFGARPSYKAIGASRAPEFMVKQQASGSLDAVVAWLISPDPASRPTVHQVLDIESLLWVHGRRRAPATIFEGNWGPDVEEVDNRTTTMTMTTTPGGAEVEMTDV